MRIGALALYVLLFFNARALLLKLRKTSRDVAQGDQVPEHFPGKITWNSGIILHTKLGMFQK